ncbi:FHA domain-containing protein [Calothrix sp. 336/3]|uniref:FHA domain-containing protein n=1 Tax=Calothrix sp. 336/3 TaxID=1337936 RepID=UPI0004E452AE|nr:FHA domain-containing protein [Calothrix sp. 336/3]AKG19935.1 peptide-binding protein [Calothrix sp. 336/3]
MNRLTLQWYDAGEMKTQQITAQQPSKHPGTVRIGRDPIRCDIILTHPTVSGLHVEIFFHPQQKLFLIRNLREQNPPMIDGKQLFQGETPIQESSIIYLGQQQLQVTALTISRHANAILSPSPIIPVKNPTPPSNQASVPAAQPVYGLECPNCHRISSIEHLQVGCPWCGTSLAAAVSVLV